jgi:hypothetical protein
MSAVSQFLEGIAKDHKQRSFAEIIHQDDIFWEEEHDFIQWLFPLNEKSMSVPNSPVIQRQEIEYIRQSTIAQQSIDKALTRYQEFLSRSIRWHDAFDHNHLRITRVMKCLKLLRDLKSARAFKYWVAHQLGDDIDNINEKTKQYWRLM